MKIATKITTGSLYRGRDWLEVLEIAVTAPDFRITLINGIYYIAGDGNGRTYRTKIPATLQHTADDCAMRRKEHFRKLREALRQAPLTE